MHCTNRIQQQFIFFVKILHFIKFMFPELHQNFWAHSDAHIHSKNTNTQGCPWEIDCRESLLITGAHLTFDSSLSISFNVVSVAILVTLTVSSWGGCWLGAEGRGEFMSCSKGGGLYPMGLAGEWCTGSTHSDPYNGAGKIVS